MASETPPDPEIAVRIESILTELSWLASRLLPECLDAEWDSEDDPGWEILTQCLHGEIETTSNVAGDLADALAKAHDEHTETDHD